MTVTYAFELTAKCPSDGSDNQYLVEVTADKFMLCESLLAMSAEFEGKAIYQEDLTEALATRLKCQVTTYGEHCGGKVQTTVKC